MRQTLKLYFAYLAFMDQRTNIALHADFITVREQFLLFFFAYITRHHCHITTLKVFTMC